MQVANQSRRKRRRRTHNSRGDGVRRTDNDPLQSFDADNVNLDNVIDEDNRDASAVGDIESDEVDTSLPVTNKSTAGRVKWQEKHKRGKFSKKYRKKEEAKVGF